jgi:hypothetical protein
MRLGHTTTGPVSHVRPEILPGRPLWTLHEYCPENIFRVGFLAKCCPSRDGSEPMRFTRDSNLRYIHTISNFPHLHINFQPHSCHIFGSIKLHNHFLLRFNRQHILLLKIRSSIVWKTHRPIQIFLIQTRGNLHVPRGFNLNEYLPVHTCTCTCIV